METTNTTGGGVDTLSAASVLTGTPATYPPAAPQIGRPVYLDCSTCDGSGEAVCCGGPCTISCPDCQGSGTQHCDFHTRSNGWTLIPAIVEIDGHPHCADCAAAAAKLADTCADCGGSTATGTPAPHVCGTCVHCDDATATVLAGGDPTCRGCAARLIVCPQCGVDRDLDTLSCEPCRLADEEMVRWDERAAAAADALFDRRRDEAFAHGEGK